MHCLVRGLFLLRKKKPLPFFVPEIGHIYFVQLFVFNTVSLFFFLLTLTDLEDLILEVSQENMQKFRLTQITVTAFAD